MSAAPADLCCAVVQMQHAAARLLPAAGYDCLLPMPIQHMRFLAVCREFDREGALRLMREHGADPAWQPSVSADA